MCKKKKVLCISKLQEFTYTLTDLQIFVLKFKLIRR